MKFDRLHYLIENVFQPVSYEERLGRKREYYKQAYGLDTDNIMNSDVDWKNVPLEVLMKLRQIYPDHKRFFEEQLSKRGKYYLFDVKRGDEVVYKRGEQIETGVFGVPNTDVINVHNMDFHWHSYIILDNGGEVLRDNKNVFKLEA